MNKKKVIISVLVLIVIAVFSFFVVKNFKNTKLIESASSEENKEQKNSVPLSPAAAELHKIQASDIVLGDIKAPVTIIEYASLSCPHCATFHEEGLPKLKSEYIDSGKVKFAHRDFPLNQPALIATMVTICTAEDNKKDQVNKYYNLLKALFKTQEAWAFSDDFILKLKSIAKLDGMSEERFDACMKSTDLQEKILKSRLEVSKILQIQSTPTFIINGQTVNGYSGYDEIKKAVDNELAKTGNSENK